MIEFYERHIKKSDRIAETSKKILDLLAEKGEPLDDEKIGILLSIVVRALQPRSSGGSLMFQAEFDSWVIDIYPKNEVQR